MRLGYIFAAYGIIYPQ